MGTIIVGVGLLGIVALIIRYIYKSKKNGSCCGSCPGCKGCSKGGCECR